MALPKPQLNGDVLAYDEIQTDGINDLETTVTDHNSKIMQLLNWMGLVKDYVKSRTYVGNWEIEEWASGWVVQTRRFETTLTFTPILGINRAVWDRADTLPISYKPSGKIYTSLENMNPTTGGSTIWSARNNSDYGRFLGGIFLSLSAGDLEVNAVFTIKGYRA